MTRRSCLVSLALIATFLPGLAFGFQAMDGGSGLFRLQDARSEGWGWLSVGANGLYRYSLYPVTEVPSTEKSHRIDLPVGISYAFTDWLEIMAAPGYAAVSNKPSTFNLNSLSGTMTDIKAGGKVMFTPWLKLLKLGLAGFYNFPQRKYALPESPDLAPFPTVFYDYTFLPGKYLEYRGLATLAFSDLSPNIPFALHANWCRIYGGNWYNDSLPNPLNNPNRTTMVGVGAELAIKGIQIYAEATSHPTIAQPILDSAARKDLAFGARFAIGPVGLGLNFDYALFRPDNDPAYPKWTYGGGVYFMSPVGRPPMGNVAGTVTDIKTGEPLAATVRLPQVKAYRNKSILVDKSGAFKVKNLPTGSVLVEAEVEGYQRFSGFAVVENGKTGTLEIKLKTLGEFGTVTGRVADAKTGTPLAATVTFPGSELAELATDPATGVYTVKNIPAGVLAVGVKVEGYRDNSASVAIKDGEVTTQNFDMQPTNVFGSLTGRVVDANTRAPLAGMITFDDASGVAAANADPATGVFNVTQIPVGTVTIDASAEGYIHEARPIVIEDGKVANAEFLLRPANEFGSISGSVTEAGTGKPIVADVSFGDPMLPAVKSEAATGFYKADKLPVGVTIVKATAEGYVPAQMTVTVEVNKVATQNFTLSPSATTGTITGMVTDSKTKGPLAAMVYVPGTTTGVMSDPTTGMYTVEVPAGAVAIACSLTGYVRQISTSPIIVKQGEPAVYNFSLLKIGTEIVMKASAIHFAFNSAEIQPAGYPALDEWVKLMNENPGMTAEIQGHTDAVGSESYNQRLSERRAAAVVDYLTGKGVARMRLTSIGYGESRLAVQTQEASEENRRVILKVTGESK